MPKEKLDLQLVDGFVEQSTPAPLPQLITFDTWFSSTGRPAHHRYGMSAYADTGGRKTKEYWDSIFKNY